MKRANNLNLLVLGLTLGAMACQPDGPPSGLIDGLELYRQNRISEAWPHFARALFEQPKNPDVHAWLAEAERRLRRPEDAIASARAALELAPCHSFAHTVLGDVYKPELAATIPEPDSSWAHSRAAVACDPEDGNARIGVWSEAIRRGERTIEDDAMRVLITSGFIPPSVLAFNRWMLRSLQDNAILITNGDWDTYPALALQIEESLRPDVVVANVNMLNLPWYEERLRERFGLPPVDAGQDDGARAARVVARWEAAGRNGTLTRPLALAVTTDTARLRGVEGSLRDAGAYRLYVVSESGLAMDTATVRASLEGLDGREFAGPQTSEADRSAVRIAADHQLGAYVFHAALRYAMALAENGRVEEATDAVEWAERFARDAEVGDEHLNRLDEVRERLP